MNQKRFSLFLLISLFGVVFDPWQIPTPAFAQGPDSMVVGAFSSSRQTEGLPAGWESLTFDKISQHTRYETVNDNGVAVIQAQSSSAASGIIRHVDIDPREYPVVAWRWKIQNVLRKGDARQKKGDDYPARLYIIFAYDAALLSWAEKVKYQAARLLYGQYPPGASITYIWANRAEKGAVMASPFTEKAMMVVVQSGNSRADQWIREQRNILSDFREAFQTEPPMISGVAIMTDTDNTGETATAWYGDIVFRRE